jgi:hypothetical protein
MGAVTTLQRAAGNSAVAGLLRPTVQRHSSWEHALLGDTPPKALGQAAVSNEGRKHVLAAEWERMKFFQNNPRANPTTRFPDVTWIKLRASELWVSNGELNALGDYLPDPGAYDPLTAEQLIPVLQKMRGVIMGSAGKEFNLRDDSSARQPGISGQDRNGRAPASTASDDDRWLGDDAIDPQSAQERYSKQGRIAGSGVSGASPSGTPTTRRT